MSLRDTTTSDLALLGHLLLEEKAFALTGGCGFLGYTRKDRQASLVAEVDFLAIL